MRKTRNYNCFIHGKGHPRWKGEKATYSAIHKWINNNFGNPKKCEDCGSVKSKKYHWANISGKYKRIRSDWKRLCAKCHKKLDKHLIARGQRSGSAKLTYKNVEEIRKFYVPRIMSLSKLANKFSVSKSAISSIILGKSWSLKD